MPPLTTAEPAVDLLATAGPAGGAGDGRGVGASLRRPLVLALGLALLAVVAYRGSLANGFVNLDDPEYVTENPVVRAGLTAAGLRWAATAIVVANWHPATLVSHMLDCQLYGLNPRGHHLTSLLLHVAATLLLFEFLRRTTGRPLPSAVVAALFAVHPTHVESVAWVAERKDVLCGVFWMATLAAYLHYGRRPGFGRYLLVAAAFALALAAKPMAVTLPLVLLLLDAWPFGRLRLGQAARDGDLAAGGERTTFLVPLILEKLPLLALSAAACVVTLRAQRGPLALDAATPWSLRLANALTSYAAYLGKTFYPVRLAVIYPFLPAVPAWRVVLAALLLAGITAGAVTWARRAPYLLVGWLWFLGTLVPVSGLVQVGAQRMADRYTYLPSIGLYLAVVWGLAGLAGGRPRLRAGLAAAALAAIVGLAWTTERQTRVWKNSITLFRHSLAVEDSYLAHADLADALVAARDRPGAYAEIHAALALQPRNPRGFAALGILLQSWGRPREAADALERSLALDPAAEVPRFVLAMALDDLGESERAIAELRTIVARDPRSLRAHIGLAALLEKRGEPDAASRERELAARAAARAAVQR
jgi:tetratricopeptide (TPR) repeat protein